MITVIDDVISKEKANEIERYVLSKEVKWDLDTHTLDQNFKVKSKDIHEFIQFRSIIKHGNRILDDKSYKYVQDILVGLSNKTGIFFNESFRIKFNLLPKCESFKETQYNTPHVDTNGDHYVLLYYINDADGDTLIFDQTMEEYKMENAWKFEKFDIKKRISPKKGRVVIFDGKHYHASSHPSKNDIRCVINMDFPKD